MYTRADFLLMHMYIFVCMYITDRYQHMQDVDNSGFLDAGEVRECLGYLNMPNSETTVMLLMSQLDPDESGTLDWDEFKVLAKQAAWSNMVVDYIPLAGDVLHIYLIYLQQS